MRICQVSFSDGRAGAYAAAYRLHSSLRLRGIASDFLVGRQSRKDPTVVGPRNSIEAAWLRGALLLDQLPNRLYRRHERAAPFSPAWLPGTLPARLNRLAPDLVHLHWVHGLLAVEELARLGRPLVWTLHDMWPFTGGCHYSGTCQRFTSGCGACPQLNSNHWPDLARLTWARKQRAWAGLELRLVAPSRWMAEQARVSALFGTRRIEVIANGLDLAIFRPYDQSVARARLGLPADRPLLLCGGIQVDDPRKGLDLLAAALSRLSDTGAAGQFELLIFGADAPATLAGLQVHNTGYVGDDASMALVYSAADLFVAPSREDNLPNTVVEALACGTPCVAFNIGGMADMIDHGQNGYLAQPYDPAALAYGINWILADETRRRALSDAARAKAATAFDQHHQAARYIELYNELTTNNQGRSA